MKQFWEVLPEEIDESDERGRQSFVLLDFVNLEVSETNYICKNG